MIPWQPKMPATDHIIQLETVCSTIFFIFIKTSRNIICITFLMEYSTSVV